MKRVLVVLFLAGATVLSLAGTASAKTYTGFACPDGGTGDTFASLTKVPASAPFTTSTVCGYSSNFRIEANKLVGGTWTGNDYVLNESATLSVTLPPGLKFVNLVQPYISQNSNDFNGMVTTFGLSNGNGTDWIAGRDISSGGADFPRIYVPAGQTRTTLEFTMRCTRAHCDNSKAWMLANYIQADLADTADPQVFLGGSMFNPGSVSGSKVVTPVSIDEGSGVTGIYLWVNGQLAGAVPNCTPPLYSFRQCPSVASDDLTLDTTKSPFVEGTNVIKACTADYSGNTDCTERTTVVDN